MPRPLTCALCSVFRATGFDFFRAPVRVLRAGWARSEQSAAVPGCNMVDWDIAGHRPEQRDPQPITPGRV